VAERELTLRIKVGDDEVVEHLQHTDAELEKLKKEAEQAGDAAEEHLDDAADAADDLGDEAEKAADQVEDASDNASGASKNLSSLSDEAYELGDALREGRFDDAASALGRVAKAAPLVTAAVGGTAAVATAGAAAFAYGTSQAIGFEEQMLGVRKTTNLTDQEITQLGSDLLDLSGKLGIARADLAQIAETAGQLGIQGRENITAFTETVGKISTVTELTADEAGKQIAKIANIFDVPIDQANKLGSVLNALSNTTTAQSGQIAAALRRAGAAGEDLGLASDQVAALGATLVDSGLRAERAGTQLRNIFTMLRTESEAVSEVVGVSTEEWTQMLEEDALGALQQYLGALGEVPKQLRTVKIEETFGRENLQAVQSLVGQIVLLENNLDTANEAFLEGTSLNEEYRKTLGAVSRQWDKLVQNLNAAAIEMTRAVLPAISGTLEGLNNLFEDSQVTAEGIKQLDDRMQETAGARELLQRYRELSSATDRTETETRELESITSKLAKRFPSLVTQYNEAGKASGIYADRLEEVLRFRREMIRQQRQKKLKEIGDTFEENSEKLERVTAQRNASLEVAQKQDEMDMGDVLGTMAVNRHSSALRTHNREAEQARARIETYGDQANQARSEIERVARTLTRLYDVSEVNQGTLANDLGIAESAAGELITRMQKLNEEINEGGDDGGDDGDDGADKYTAVEKVQRDLIDSINEAKEVESELQKQFNAATTDEARREYQALKEKAKEMRKEMVAAAKAPANVETEGITPPVVDAGHDEAPVVDQHFSFQGRLTNLDLTESIESVEGFRAAVKQGLIDSIAAADHAVQDLQAAYDNATTDNARQEIQALIDKLKNQRAEMERTSKNTSMSFQQVAQGTQKFAGEMAQAFKGFQQATEEHHRGIFQAYKAFAITEAIASTYLAANKALASAPPPLNYALMAATIAKGLANVARIKSAEPPGGGGGSGSSQGGTPRVPRMAQGGRVTEGGMVLVGEEGPEAVHLPAGAEVMPNRETRAMLGAMRQVPARALTGDAAGVGGGGAAPSNEKVIAAIKDLEKTLEGQRMKVRGSDLVTVVERTKGIQRDAGIK